MIRKYSAKSLLLSLFLLFVQLSGAAEDLVGFPEAAANYQAYPTSFPALTPAPAGYEPFHIEHYGRHGSRWLIGEDRYQYPVDVLEMAARNGALTERGAEVLTELKPLREAARGRDGELTPLGAEQHKGIARRMARNFPQVFAPEATVEARSTVVIRCILSMLNAVEELRGIYTDLNIHTDASNADMYYMNHQGETDASRAVEAAKPVLDRYREAHPVSGDFARVLINNEKLIADSVEIKRFMDDLFDIAANSVSHGAQSPIADVFTPEEVHNQWLKHNAFWFLRNGNSKLTGNIASNHQVNLLHNVVLSADTAMTSPHHSVNLRFGHEGNLIALVVLLELDDFAREIDSLDDVYPLWRDYEIFPMGANVQLVFYRPRRGAYTEDEVLVKALLNEREVRLPATPVSGPYYRWTDLKSRYLSKK